MALAQRGGRTEAVRDKVEVKAVWDSDLRTLLGKLGILEALLTGSVSCVVCGRNVDLDSLGAIVPSRDGVEVTCDCARCIRAVTAPIAVE